MLRKVTVTPEDLITVGEINCASCGTTIPPHTGLGLCKAKEIVDLLVGESITWKDIK
jgi:hypothetical protein